MKKIIKRIGTMLLTFIIVMGYINISEIGMIETHAEKLYYATFIDMVQSTGEILNTRVQVRSTTDLNNSLSHGEWTEYADPASLGEDPIPNVYYDGYYYVGKSERVLWHYEPTVYRYFEPVTYKVEYNAGSGTGTMENGTKKHNVDYIIPESQFTPPDGYYFDCWSLNANGLIYLGSTSATDSNCWVSGNKTTIRQYYSNYITVPAGGSIVIQCSGFCCGCDYINNTYMWYKNDVLVGSTNLNLGKGEYSIQSEYKTYTYYNTSDTDETWRVYCNAKRHTGNHCFTGNNIYATISATVYEKYNEDYTYLPGEIYSGNDNLQLYAQYAKPSSYIIRFKGNGNTSGSTKEMRNVPYYDSVKLNPNGFEKKGYFFDHWNTSPDDTGISFSDEQEVKELAVGIIVLYAQWRPIEYDIYYEKGITDDTQNTSIANATRDTDIQNTETNRPYTHCKYDSPVSFATIGTVLGRNYTLSFDTNKPVSIKNQKQDNYAVPTIVSPVAGNLPCKNQWQITGQEEDVTSNLTPTMGETVESPNYVSVDSESVTATALWKDITLNNFNSPTLTGWEFVGWYDNQLGSPSETKTYDTDKYKQTASGKVISETVYPSTDKFNKTLYARWKRTIHLTFDMNGGFYQGDSKDVTLTGIYYNNADGYDFSLTSTPTPESLPNYEKQQGVIDAYGSYNMDDEYGKNGENQKYVKTDAEGITYRFLGWSLDKNATEPDNRFISFLESHQKDFRIYDDTTLYAVWEPVLITNIMLKRTLGDLKFNNGDTPLSNVQNVRASSENKNVEVIAKPGEQCNYIIATKGRKEIQAKVIFDSKITDIYTNTGIWTDNLNPNTKTGEELSEYHGLDRLIKLGAINSVMKKFYIPQYLGTSQSFESSIGETQYQMIFSIEQDSYFYKLVYDDKEKAEIYGTIYITTYKSGDGTDETPVNPSEPITSVLDELRAKLKIRLK